MNHRSALIAVPLALGLSVVIQAQDATRADSDSSGPRIYSGEVVSQTYRIDRIYKSMLGPSSTVGVRLLDTPEQELLWIVGYRAEVIDAETLEAVSQEFMCHTNLDLANGEWGVVTPSADGRLFTLSQGQQEVRFPDHFGIPVLSNQRLVLNTMVLNLNLPAADLSVKHRVEILIMRDKDLTKPMRPLYQNGVQVLKSLDEARYYGLAPGEADPTQHGSSCAVGQAASDHVHTDDLGQRFIAHWVVSPGREVSRSNVTRQLALHRDTTIHYVAVHLHPFAESLELIDLTKKETVFKATAKNSRGRVGLDHVDVFSSEDGIPVYKDHEYELVNVYNNTSDEPADAMAVMLLYMLDHDFRKPAF